VIFPAAHIDARRMQRGRQSFKQVRLVCLLSVVSLPHHMLVLSSESGGTRPGCESVNESLQPGRARWASQRTATKPSIARNRRNAQKRTQRHHIVVGLSCQQRPFQRLTLEPVSGCIDIPAKSTAQNVNVSSSAIMMTGGPPDDIFAAWAKVCLPPVDSAHCWSASMEGK